MKIKYTFATGETTLVEVNDEIGTIIMDSRRAEHAQDEKQRYHSYPLDVTWETLEVSTAETPETLMLDEFNNSKLYAAFDKLTDIQKQRLLMLANGMSVREIARREGKDHKTVLESIEAARKKIKKFL